MKFSYLVIKGIAFAITVLPVLNASAQSEPVAAPRDYSFTIPTTQPWTDTGVDLQAGELLEITATAAQSAGTGAPSSGSAEPCDPRGVSGSTEANASLPVAAAPEGALIARLQAQEEAVAVSASRKLKVDAPGHLFFGVNASAPPDCTGSFAVKVHVTSAGTTTPAAVTGHALVSTSVVSSLSAPSSSASSLSTTSSTTPNSAQSLPPTKPAPAQDIKSKLANAAQVFMAGQFGTGANSASSSSAKPLSNDAVSSNSAPSAGAPAPPALTVSTAAPDSGLRKNIDDLPRRVNDQFNNQGDMVNFVLIGSQQQVQGALEAANWHVADTDNKEAVLKAVLETYQKKDYLQMPMSQLYLFGRKQDFGYELAAAYSVVASRHHFRVWKAPSTWNGQTLWAGAGTHDIGFEKDQRNGSVTHKIDPAVDGERDNIGQTLQQAGKVKSMSYYLPPDPVQGSKNATGGGYHSDGRILVIVLQ